MSVSKRLRYEVLRRDNHTCRYCGAAAPDVKLTVDHVVPVALGGSDEPANLATACSACNSGKTSSSPDAPLVEDVAQDALRWSRAMEKAAELQTVEALEWERRAYEVADRWADVVAMAKSWTIRRTLNSETGNQDYYVHEEGYGCISLIVAEEYIAGYEMLQCAEEVAPRPEDYLESVISWLKAGLSAQDMWRLMDVALKNDRVTWDAKWRYFAGCCWNHLKERQTIARQLIEAQDGDA